MVLLILHLDIQKRWIATILIRSPGSRDRHLAIRTHDFPKVHEFVGSHGGQAGEIALRDLGLPSGFGRSEIVRDSADQSGQHIFV